MENKQERENGLFWGGGEELRLPRSTASRSRKSDDVEEAEKEIDGIRSANALLRTMLSRKEEEVDSVQQQLAGSREDTAGQVSHLSNINSQLSLLVQNRDELIQSLRRSNSQHLLQINSLHTSFADFRSSHRQILYRLFSTRATIRSYLLLRVALHSLHANAAARARLRTLSSSLLGARTIPLLRDLRRAALAIRFRAAAQRAALLYVQRVLGGLWTETLVRPAFNLLVWGCAEKWRRQRGCELFARLLARLLRRQNKRRALAVWRCGCTRSRILQNRCVPLIGAISIVFILRPAFAFWYRRAVTTPATLSAAISIGIRASLRCSFFFLSEHVSQQRLMSLHSSHLLQLHQIRAANSRREERILATLARTVYVQRQQWALGRLRGAARATREAEEEWSRRSRGRRRAVYPHIAGRATGRHPSRFVEQAWRRWRLARARGKALHRLCLIRRRRQEEVGWRRWREFVAYKRSSTVVRGGEGLRMWVALSRVIRRIRTTVMVEWSTWHRYVAPCRIAWFDAFVVRCCASAVRRAFTGWRHVVAARRRCRRLASLMWTKLTWPAFYRLRNTVCLMRYSEHTASLVKLSSLQLRAQTPLKLNRLLDGTLHSRALLSHFFRSWRGLSLARRAQLSRGATWLQRLRSHYIARDASSLLCRWHYVSIQMRGEQDRAAATEMVVSAHTKCSQLRVLCGGVWMVERVKGLMCRLALRRTVSEWRQLVRRMGEEEMRARQAAALEEMKNRQMRSLNAHSEHAQQLQEQVFTLQERTKDLNEVEKRLRESEAAREQAVVEVARSKEELQRREAKAQAQSEFIDVAQSEVAEIKWSVEQMQRHQKEKEEELVEDIKAGKTQLAEKEKVVKELMRRSEEENRALEAAGARERHAMEQQQSEKQAMAIELEGVQKALKVAQMKASIQADQLKWLRTETKELQLLAEHRREPKHPSPASSSNARRQLPSTADELQQRHVGGEETVQATDKQKGHVNVPTTQELSYLRGPQLSLLTSPSPPPNRVPPRRPMFGSSAAAGAKEVVAAKVVATGGTAGKGGVEEVPWGACSLLRLPGDSGDEASSGEGEMVWWPKGRVPTTSRGDKATKGSAKRSLGDTTLSSPEAKDKGDDAKVSGKESQGIGKGRQNI
eukprot:GHVS01028908.1.p1 GENE.GHVS01028908.1~~GHVS01028908.1.p1  ORF type:complete len:1131 (+),score=177.00 GHVS01028908.1:295-3687(+)